MYSNTDTEKPNLLLDLVGLAQYGQQQAAPRLLETQAGQYLWTAKEGAKPLPPVPEKPPVESRTVSTVESLAAAALEELERDSNTDGRGMTVIFDLKGATLFINDDQQWRQWRYHRAHSQQWDFLTRHADQILEHKNLLRFIQGLRPSITNYAEMFRAIRRVSVTDKAKLVSNPILEDGKLGSSLSFDLEIEGGGVDKQTVPTELEVTMTYTRGGLKTYTFPLTLDVERIKKDDHFTAGFRLGFVDRGVIEDQAIADEVAYFTEKTAAKPAILKLLNYH